MSLKAYTYEAGRLEVTPEIKADFDNKGYMLVRNLLNEEELQKIRGVLEDSDAVSRFAHDVGDGADRKSRICLWNHPGNDLTGMLARSEKVAGTCEKLLGGEVYHYHTKLMMKEAYTGGRFMWHQDYGYWYKNACLAPDLVTVFIAIDPSRRDNGCLQILEGSSRCGRIDHVPSPGDQMQADPEEWSSSRHGVATCDALFFHCNLIHASSQNNSPNRRWAFLTAYNRANNNPLIEHFHPFYTKLHKVPDTAILESKVDWDLDSKDFLTQEKRDAVWKKLNNPGTVH